MPASMFSFRRLLVGRPGPVGKGRPEPLTERRALAAFGSGPLGSIAYVPDEVLAVLAVTGGAAALWSAWTIAAFAAVMLVVVLTGRQLVIHYPEGGGDYEVVRATLGRRTALVTGAGMLVDYVLTGAIAVSAAAHYVGAAVPGLQGQETWIAGILALVVLVTALRGMRRSGRVLSLMLYVATSVTVLLVLVGLVEWALGALPGAPAPSAASSGPAGAEPAVLAGGLVAVRAFAGATGSFAGIQTLGQAVPAFRPPRGRHAAIVLVLIATVTTGLLAGTVALAQHIGAPGGEGTAPGPDPVLARIAVAVTRSDAAGGVIAVLLAVVLLIAADMALSGFPALASVLAKDGFLPRQMRMRHDRMATADGMILLGLAMTVIVLLARADVTALFGMYMIGALTALALSRAGLVRHFTHRLGLATDRSSRVALRLNRVAAIAGTIALSLVALVVIVARVAGSGWIAILAITLITVVMAGVRSHYESVNEEVGIDPAGEDPQLRPSRSHALVLISRIDKPSMRALAYAASTRPTTLEAVTVRADPEDSDEFVRRWRSLDMQVPLRIIYSPRHDVVGPVVAHVGVLGRRHPRDVVVVYVSEYMVGHWWEGLLHNHAAVRLKTRLERLPRVVVASVPWQLQSFQDALAHRDR